MKKYYVYLTTREIVRVIGANSWRWYDRWIEFFDGDRKVATFRTETVCGVTEEPAEVKVL